MRFHAALSSVIAVAVVAMLSGAAQGQITAFFDTFDRPNNANISASTAGMSGTFTTPTPITYIERSDTQLTTLGALTRIQGNQLQLANSTNASVIHPDRNFINPGSTTMSVSLDLLANNGPDENGPAFFAGFGFGATQAEAAAAGFDNGAGANGNPAGWKGNQGGNILNSGFADFYVAWELVGVNTNTGRFAIWKNGQRTAIFDNGGGNYTIGDTLKVDLSFANFNAGTPVSATILYGDTVIGTDTFAWDHTDSNYIGITARQGNPGFQVDNFLVQFDTTPVEAAKLIVDRATGNITFENTTSSPITLIGYTIQGANTAFNTSAWNQLDILDDGQNNNSWEMLTPDNPNGSGIPENPTTNLSEGTLGAGYTVAANGGTINFGNAWIRSPFEQFGTVEFYNSADQRVPIYVQMVGNNGDRFLLGDFDFMDSGNDGSRIDAADWAILRSNLISTPAVSGLLTYGYGDMNFDGVVNEADFDAFKVAFDAANGAGSFAAMLSGATVPEPGTLAMLTLAGVGLLLARSRRSGKTLALVLAFAGFTAMASAQTNLFSDNYDRSNSLDVDASSEGMSGLHAPTMVYNEYGENLVAPDIMPELGGPAALTSVDSSQLWVANGTNASAYYLEHNFIDSAITADGVMSIKIDIVNNGSGAAIQHFVGFGVGALQSEFTDQEDLDEGAQVDSPALRGNVNRANTGFADLWVGWSPNNGGRIQVVKNGNLVQNIDDGIDNARIGSETGPIQPSATLDTPGVLELRMSIADFNAGTQVPATIYLNGVAVGGDVFRWDHTNANYIGFAARQGDPGFRLDNLAITTITTPMDVPTLTLEVNTETGEAFLVGGALDYDIDRYTIRSTGGLNADEFNGIRGDSGLPAGNGSGNGWELGGVQTSSLLSEFFLGTTGQGSSTIGASFRASLGEIYSGVQDLVLEYHTTSGGTVRALTTYVTSELLPGDFNGDGTVNLADYTVWRDNLGANESTNVLNGNGNGGVVDATDYTLWKSKFGTGGSLASIGAASPQNVPEPTTVSLAAFAMLLGIVMVRNRPQRGTQF